MEVPTLAIAISDLSVNRQGLLVAVDGLIDVAQVIGAEAEVAESPTLTAPILELSMDGQGLLKAVESLFVLLQTTAGRSDARQHPGLGLSVVSSPSGGTTDLAHAPPIRPVQADSRKAEHCVGEL